MMNREARDVHSETAIAETGRSSRRSARRLVAAGIAGLAVAGGGGWLVQELSGGAGGASDATAPPPAKVDRVVQTDAGSYDGPAGLVAPGEPCPGAEFRSLRALESDAPVYAPEDPTSVKRAWNCGDTAVLMVGDVQLSFETGWDDVDVDRKWQQTIEESGGSVRNLLGEPALVEAKEQTGAPSDQVLVVIDGTLIRALSSGTANIEEVVETVDSLDVAHPLKLG